MPNLDRLLHYLLHPDWIKLDDFWSRRSVAVEIHCRYGITLDPRSIFCLVAELYVFYAVDRGGKRAFYWCRELDSRIQPTFERVAIPTGISI